MYQYKKNRFLREVFPKQFDTVPHIIIWTIVFLADVALVFVAAWLLGIPLPIGGTWGKIGLILYMVIAFALFILESLVYHRIVE